MRTFKTPVVASSFLLLLVILAYAFPVRSLAAYGDTLRIMPLGDSITYGSGEERGGYRYYLYNLLIQNGYDFGFVGSQTGNSGGLPEIHHEGRPSYFLIDDNSLSDPPRQFYGALLSELIPAYDPDVILFLLGTNDIDYLFDPDGIDNKVAEYAAVLTQIFTLKPDVRLVAAPLPYTLVCDTQAFDQFNAGIERVVNRFRALDYRIAWAADMTTAVPHTSLGLPDLFHPRTQGYSNLAHVWFNGLQQLVGGLNPPTAPPNPSALADVGRATLHWTSVPFAKSYNVYRSNASCFEDWTPAATGLTSPIFIDTNLINGNTYYYQVTSVNEDGESGKSWEISAQPFEPVRDNVISIQFSGSRIDYRMTPGEYAGVVAQPRWNVADGVSGSRRLTDSRGSQLAAVLNWSADQGARTSIPVSPGNFRLMKGYIKASASKDVQIEVKGLPAAYTQRGYDVYVYYYSGTTDCRGLFTVGMQQVTAMALEQFAGRFQLAGEATPGNYVVFRDLKESDLTLNVALLSKIAAVNGIQIIARP